MADVKISALPASTTPLAGTEVVPLVQSGVTKKVAVSDLTAGRSVASGQLTATSTTDSGTIAKGWSPNGGANASNGSVQIGGVSDYCLRASFDATGANVGMAYLDNTYNDSSSKLRARLRTQGTPLNGWTLVPNGATADLQLDTGNLVIGTSGKGIDFSATPGTGTSELLADYEEGTFSPVIEGTTTIGTATYGSQVGRYTKIGRQVSFEIAIDWSAGSGAGVLRIAGLPFTSSATASYPGACIGIIDSVALALTTYPTAFVRANSTQISLRQSPTGGGSSTDVAYDAAGFISLSGFYTV